MSKKELENTTQLTAQLVIFPEGDVYKKQAEELSRKLEAKIVTELPVEESGILALHLSNDGISLVGNGQTLQCDLSHMLSRAKPNNLNGELLIKTAKIKGVEGTLTAIDATAGFGEDAFLLAAVGFRVKLYEKDTVIAALLQDALRRSKLKPELAEITNRMELMEEDSLVALPQLTEEADVILLDPMFPARQKSGLIKKKFQLLQQLERPCSDEEELLNAAISNHPRKVVIKRPLKGAYLAGRKPDYSIKGKAIRYDCIVIPRHMASPNIAEETK